MRRRALLGALGTAATAGCLSALGLETRSARVPPVVEDRPDAVYHPTHVEGMETAGTAELGPYSAAVTYSFPHRFWLVTGTNREKVTVEPEDSVHLMVTLRDRGTGVVLPTTSVSLEVTRDGDTVVERPPWPMLSQNMGFHFGDNVALDGAGSYEVTVGVGPVGARRAGAFRDRFGDAVSGTVTFEFDPATLESLPVERFEEEAGARGAVDPMAMGKPSQLPPASALPGTGIGEASSGDARFVAVALDGPPAGVDGDGPYLAVSARTPYNRYPLPFMALDAALSRGGETVAETPLEPTLHPGLGYHYGTVVPSLRGGDRLELTPGAPPQVARHEGYETAFFDLSPVTLGVPDGTPTG